MDVEGFESFVLEGGERLFTEHRVWFLATELNPVLLRGATKSDTAGATFLNTLLR